MDSKPTTSPAVWDLLRKRFEKLDAKQKGIDQDRRLRGNAELSEDLDRNRPDFRLSGGKSELYREKYLTIATAAGIAIGASPDEAVAAWIEHVVGYAMEHRSDLWHSLRETVKLPQTAGPRVEITAEDTGRLDCLCEASAASCERLWRDALTAAARRRTRLLGPTPAQLRDATGPSLATLPAWVRTPPPPSKQRRGKKKKAKTAPVPSRHERVKEFLRRMHKPPEPEFNLSQFWIAAGVDQADGRRWKRGELDIRPHIAERIEKTLKMKRDKFVHELNERPRHVKRHPQQ